MSEGTEGRGPDSGAESRPGSSRSRLSDPERLEAFSDGVFAVIITLTALELPMPKGGSFRAFSDIVPDLLIYVLSFAFVGIYWNNHHHMLRSTERISAAVMWANLHLLFWLSLIPFLTQWLGRYHAEHAPASVYGADCVASAIAYTILQAAIIHCNGRESAVARGVGNDLKGRLSILLYMLGVGGAWITPWIAYALYAAVSVMWLVPDRRLAEQA